MIQKGDKVRNKHYNGSRIWEVIDIDLVNKTYTLTDQNLDIKLEINHAIMESDYEKVDESNNSVCFEHNWKTYTGFTESYQYCEKCGEKKYV